MTPQTPKPGIAGLSLTRGWLNFRFPWFL